jgi:hypothetical protein
MFLPRDADADDEAEDFRDLLGGLLLLLTLAARGGRGGDADRVAVVMVVGVSSLDRERESPRTTN